MRRYLIACLLVFGCCGVALADVSCDSQCESGEKMISFGDGDEITCECVPEGEGMDETVPDASVGSPGESDT